MTFTVQQVILNLKCITCTYFEGSGDFKSDIQASEWDQAVRYCITRPISSFNDLLRYNITTGDRRWTGIRRTTDQKWSGSGNSVGGQYSQIQKNLNLLPSLSTT